MGCIHAFSLLQFLLLCAQAQALRRVSVSGQSAGASMAIQHLFAHSSTVDGAAIVAGSPYGCGELKLPNTVCYFDEAGLLDLQMGATLKYVAKLAAQGSIDDPVHLQGIPVLLFSGSNDFIVWSSVMRAVRKQLLHYADSPARIVSQFETAASHTWSVDHGDCGCGSCVFENATGGESVECCDVNNCGYDLTGQMLAHIYGAVSLKPRGDASTARLRVVNQWKYLPTSVTANASRLLQHALLYVPQHCEQRPDQCRTHINYHGCTENIWDRRKAWVTLIDLNQYGESNNITILYPQAGGSASIGEGCWNWESKQDDPNYDTKSSIQLSTVVKIVEDLPNIVKSSNQL